MLICTIGAVILALVADKDPTVEMRAHNIAGFVSLFFIVITGLLGLTRVFLPICCNMDWKSQ